MERRLVIWGFGALLALTSVVAGATSARAFTLTGTWEGTYACKGVTSTGKDAYVDQLVAKITQVGTGVGAEITFNGNPFRYNGIAVANVTKPDKGDVVLVLCGTDDDTGTGLYDELGRFGVTTKPAKGTGSIKGISQFSTPEPAAYTCKWKLKRTDATDPVVTVACP